MTLPLPMTTKPFDKLLQSRIRLHATTLGLASNYAWFSIQLHLAASAANILVIKAIWHWLTVMVIKAIWHWLTVMHHHTNFGYQGQSSSEDPDWQTPGWGYNETRECGWEADGQFVTHSRQCHTGVWSGPGTRGAQKLDVVCWKPSNLFPLTTSLEVINNINTFFQPYVPFFSWTIQSIEQKQKQGIMVIKTKQLAHG